MAALITARGRQRRSAISIQKQLAVHCPGRRYWRDKFFCLLILCQTGEERWKITGESMRTAMAGAIVVEYLALVGTLAFFVQGEMPPIAQTMITNFTTVVGIVIAFYFGASAFVQLQREKQENRKVKADENTVDATAASPEAEKL
jgi:hypothetical protein